MQKLLITILLLSSAFFFGCAETDACEKINKESDCVKYNNCNILENWRLQRIKFEHKCSGSDFTTYTLFQDNLVVFKDGSLQLRLSDKLSLLDKWEFSDCKKLKLSSSKIDSTFTFDIETMESNKMEWSYEYTDSCQVKATMYFDRM
jgi:hypothetical protein